MVVIEYEEVDELHLKVAGKFAKPHRAPLILVACPEHIGRGAMDQDEPRRVQLLAARDEAVNVKVNVGQ